MARLTAAPFAFAMSEDRDLAPKLARIGDHNQPIPLGELAALSDLDQDELALFRAEWPEFEQAHRRAVAQAMQELGEESLELDFREAFVAMLDDEDASVRVAAARGLNEDTRRSTLRKLLRTLADDPEEAVQAAVATTLGAWTLQVAEGDLDSRFSDEIEQALLAAYNDSSRPLLVRQRLLETLGYLGDQPAVLAAIEAAQRHPDESWQQSALCAMGHTSLKRWLAPIKQAFGHKSPALRFEAVRAAGELADIALTLVPDVARLAADRDIEVSTTAIWALGQIGGPASKRFLEQLAKEGEGARLEAASEAISEVQFFDDPMGNIALADDDDDEWDEE